MSESFSGRTVVITGGASGLGRSTALEFARRGATVGIADIHDERTAEVVAELQGLGVKAAGFRCDVTVDADVSQLASDTIDSFGQVDIVMQNAGVMTTGPAHEVPLAEWERILSINVLGLVRGAHAFVPHFLERGSGHVVNTASLAGMYAHSYDSPAYTTSKFAAYGLSEALYLYLKPLGIDVTVICPGIIATNLGETLRSFGTPDLGEWIHIPENLNAFVDPDDLAPTIVNGVADKTFLVITHPEGHHEYTAARRGDPQAGMDAQIAAAPTPPLPDKS